MPQPIMTVYKQGDTGRDYPKEKDTMIKMKDWDTANINPAVCEMTVKDKKKHVDESFLAKANEKDY